MYDIKDKRAAIAEIQRYLVTIYRSRDQRPCIVTDGIYDDKTAECVMSFQRENTLTPTGKVNLETFDLLYSQYLIALEILYPERCVMTLPQKLEGQRLKKGEVSSEVAIIQALLKNLYVIDDVYGDIDINGIFDDVTEEGVKSVQSLYSLPRDGIINRATFNAIANEYEKFLNRDV